MNRTCPPCFQVAPRVAEAVAAGDPVVALETTLITHGLPPGDGLRVAMGLEEEVTAAGAVPATIGILDGVLRVGLSDGDISRLAGEPDVVKVNPGNLAATLAVDACGSTTVAATLFAAARAGIRVFATGGIGGVHRGAEASGDVSADLTALARYPVAVVCAGAKSVLDLPRTLEALETLGVPILGHGTAVFPAFYRRDSGLPVDRGFASVVELARAVRTHFDLGLPGGVVIANPIPAEHEMPADMAQDALERALAEAEAAGIRGRGLTPFLLARMEHLTVGASVRVNEVLLRGNASVAASLAVAMAAHRP
jgi:pseudouridine-5'-phosphate glycosidase